MNVLRCIMVRIILPSFHLCKWRKPLGSSTTIATMWFASSYT